MFVLCSAVCYGNEIVSSSDDEVLFFFNYEAQLNLFFINTLLKKQNQLFIVFVF